MLTKKQMRKIQIPCRMFVLRLSQHLIISATKCRGSIQDAQHVAQKFLKDGLMDTVGKQIQPLASTTGKNTIIKPYK